MFSPARYGPQRQCNKTSHDRNKAKTRIFVTKDLDSEIQNWKNAAEAEARARPSLATVSLSWPFPNPLQNLGGKESVKSPLASYSGRNWE